ncbi:MAG: sensor domain-containing phosphodiesterase [Jatrophihabitantaceae bacterium]
MERVHVFGSRSTLAGWCLVGVLSFPFALLLMLSEHHRAGLPGAGAGAVVVLVSLLLAVLRIVAWLVFWRHWRAAERVRQARANRRLSAIAASCQEMLWETRGERFVYLAPSVSDYLGYRPGELLGKSAVAIVADVDKPRLRQLLRACALSGCGWTDETFTFVANNGELREFRSSGLAQCDGHGKVIGFAGALRGLDGLPERRHTQRLHEQVRCVIEQRSLRIVFQPVIDTTSGLAVGAEALTRFPATDPVLSPEQWFSAAVGAGLGAELELAAIGQGLDSAAATLPCELYLAVNISPATLLRGGLAELIDASGWDPARLVVEITEHVRVEDYQHLIECTGSLRRRGVLLAIDDAGAGYASFRHILALRPDYIKLDRGLIAGIDADPGKRALVKAVTSFAGDIGATVIAEGIETARELHAATVMGAQAAQGFHLAAPGPVTDWPALYRNPGWITITAPPAETIALPASAPADNDRHGPQTSAPVSGLVTN